MLKLENEKEKELILLTTKKKRKSKQFPSLVIFKWKRVDGG